MNKHQHWEFLFIFWSRLIHVQNQTVLIANYLGSIVQIIQLGTNVAQLGVVLHTSWSK